MLIATNLIVLDTETEFEDQAFEKFLDDYRSQIVVHKIRDEWKLLSGILRFRALKDMGQVTVPCTVLNLIRNDDGLVIATTPEN